LRGEFEGFGEVRNFREAPKKISSLGFNVEKRPGKGRQGGKKSGGDGCKPRNGLHFRGVKTKLRWKDRVIARAKKRSEDETGEKNVNPGTLTIEKNHPKRLLGLPRGGGDQGEKKGVGKKARLGEWVCPKNEKQGTTKRKKEKSELNVSIRRS